MSYARGGFYGEEDEQEDDYDEALAQGALSDDETERDVSRFELLAVPHDLEDSEITGVQIQNDVVAILGKSGKIVVRDRDSDDPPTNFRPVPSAHKIFLDPLGRHVLVSTTAGELYYFLVKSKVAQTKFLVSPSAVAVVESVGWDKTNTSEQSTSSIIVGTRETGLLIEIRVDIPATGIPQVVTCKQLLERRGETFTGIEVEHTGQFKEGILVIATTSVRMYRFMGLSHFENLFKRYSEDHPPQFTEMPSGDVQSRGTLVTFRSSLSKPVQAFAWLSSVGIVHGLINMNKVQTEDADKEYTDLGESPTGDTDPVIGNQSILYFGGPQRIGTGFDKLPQDITLSAFHICLMLEDRITVLSVPPGMTRKPISGSDLQLHDYQDRVQYEHRFRKAKAARSFLRDVAKRKIYSWDSESIWELSIENEAANQYKLFLDRALDPSEGDMRLRYFNAAKKLSNRYPTKKDMVTFALGNFYLAAKQYIKAASAFSECNMFEEVVARLSMQAPSWVLHDFLKQRFQYLMDTREGGDKSQLACLATYIAQLHLDGIATRETHELSEESSLFDFLQEAHEDGVNFEDKGLYAVIARLLGSHGRMELLLQFADMMGRYKFAIAHYINTRQYSKACDVLCTRCTGPDDKLIWYDYATILIQYTPAKLVTGFIKQKAFLEPVKLLPALVSYKPEMNEDPEDKENQVISYLRFIVDGGNEDVAIHNLLLRLYATLMPSELDDFLEFSKFYDPQYALRVCLECKLPSPCMLLYKHLSLLDDAVAIALELRDVVTAKQIADIPKGSEEADVRKRLWLEVAKYVVRQDQSTKRALAIIDDSKGVLKLEDVLPYFSDNSVIQDFKQAICTSLEEYAKSIRVLKDEMVEATRTAKNIKEDISAVRYRFGYVTAGQKCELCGKGLLYGGNPFLVYASCRHVFHETCVTTKMLSYGEEAVEDALRASRDEVKNIRELAASECVQCGEFAVREIVTPFFIEGQDPSWSLQEAP